MFVHPHLEDVGPVLAQVRRESRRSLFVSVCAEEGDSLHTRVESELPTAFSVKRMQRESFQSRKDADDTLKKRCSNQLDKLSEGSLGHLDKALALAVTGGPSAKVRAAAQRFLAVADHVTSAQATGLRVKDMQHESGDRE
eukprot:Skav206995  [mRNA]  locus=scaffold3805:95251:95670:+ [translate_table: standard]